MRNIYLLGLFILLSCGQRKINVKNFEDFRNSFELEISGNKEFINTEKSLDKELTNYFGELDYSKQKKLLFMEIQSLKEDSSKVLSPSKIDMTRDTIIDLIRCGTYDSTDRNIPKGYSRASRLMMPQIIREINYIPINFYIINKDTLDDIQVTRNDLLVQIDILNKAFNELNIVFVLGKVEPYKNNEWYLAFSSNETKHKRFNTYYKDMIEKLPLEIDKLNVIINNCALYGQASFPFEKSTYKTKHDNIIINKNTLKNGKFGMEGKTLIHEMGHFFGLYHTFHSTQNIPCWSPSYNGCDEGDFVSDTPPQRYCHQKGCDTSINTCDSDNVPDDVKNYMGYNPDYCMSRFTEGQYIRMEEYFYDLRYYLSDKSDLF